MKLIVETTGPFGLTDIVRFQEIHHDRPTVVEFTTWIEGQANAPSPKLRILAEDVGDDVSDIQLRDYIKAQETPLEGTDWVADFLGLPSIEPTPTPTPAEDTPAEDTPAPVVVETAAEASKKNTRAKAK